ncbi:hypothetical protein [Roseibium litorale]|uniref:Uncharacterized protein n=1 Tax=Roseibium litorale TaxID=2803841 RepID=A0ABR9CJ15_9HYPH|nr:hypothetical protein [Roseibium litorale]MBD8890824.1 hypothetical protein [Roseibium litorale]
MTVPGEITHYFSRSDRPFRNLGDLEEQDAAKVIDALQKRRLNNPGFKRVFGRTYLDFRQRTEARMREIFAANGGKPERRSPHYFVLGTCDWFADLYPDTGTVSLDWRELPREIASFTYPDSFISMRFGEEYGLPHMPLEPYHEKVFFLDELESVVERYGLPDGSKDETYEGYHTRKFEKYIEVQVWSDKPVSEHLVRLEDGA